MADAKSATANLRRRKLLERALRAAFLSNDGSNYLIQMQDDTVDFCLLENASKHFGFAPTKMADPFLMAASSLDG